MKSRIYVAYTFAGTFTDSVIKNDGHAKPYLFSSSNDFTFENMRNKIRSFQVSHVGITNN